MGYVHNLNGVRWAMPGNTVDLLASWNEGNNDNNDKWKIVSESIWGTIWKEKNSRRFADTSCSLQKTESSPVVFFLGFGANPKI